MRETTQAIAELGRGLGYLLLVVFLCLITSVGFAIYFAIN